MLWILCAIALFTGYAVGGVQASTVVIMILFALVGWKLFGPVLQ